MLLSPNEVHEMLKELIVELPKRGIKLDVTLKGLSELRHVLMNGIEDLILTNRRYDKDKIFVAITNPSMGIKSRYGYNDLISLEYIAMWFSKIDIIFITSEYTEQYR